MTITVTREAHNLEADGSITATFATAPATNRALVAFASGYTTAAQNITPPASGPTWTQRATRNSTIGALLQTRIWTAVGDGSTSAFTFTGFDTADYGGLIVVELSAVDLGGTWFIDATTAGPTQNDTTADCPSATAANADDFALWFVHFVQQATGQARTLSWSGDADIVEQLEFQRPDNYDNWGFASEQLSASGATGTRVATISQADSGTYWLTGSIIIKSAATTTVPDAVDDLAGSAADQQVALTWTAPADGGAEITDYVVQYREA